MQLDFTQLSSKFESFTSLRPMPHKEYVELYIKAFYLTEDKLEEWIKEHKVRILILPNSTFDIFMTIK